MSPSTAQQMDFHSQLRPETELEIRLLATTEFQEGLMWGKPRFGHPEGKVLYHVKEVLANIDRLELNPEDRSILRQVAYLHDTFKFQEELFATPRSWNQNHAKLARNFSEQYIQDPFVLDLIEMHDEAYFAWRNIYLYSQTEKGFAGIDKIKSAFNDRFQLYYLFFKCDTRTGDKNQTPLKWFEEAFCEIEKVKL